VFTTKLVKSPSVLDMRLKKNAVEVELSAGAPANVCIVVMLLNTLSHRPISVMVMADSAPEFHVAVKLTLNTPFDGLVKLPDWLFAFVLTGVVKPVVLKVVELPPVPNCTYVPMLPQLCAGMKAACELFAMLSIAKKLPSIISPALTI